MGNLSLFALPFAFLSIIVGNILYFVGFGDPYFIRVPFPSSLNVVSLGFFIRCEITLLIDNETEITCCGSYTDEDIARMPFIRISRTLLYTYAAVLVAQLIFTTAIFTAFLFRKVGHTGFLVAHLMLALGVCLLSTTCLAYSASSIASYHMSRAFDQGFYEALFGLLLILFSNGLTAFVVSRILLRRFMRALRSVQPKRSTDNTSDDVDFTDPERNDFLNEIEDHIDLRHRVSDTTDSRTLLEL